MTARPEREVIFEITRVGEAQRVAAIDVETGAEAVVVTPANTALADAQALALRKLDRVSARRAAPDPSRKPGVIV